MGKQSAWPSLPRGVERSPELVLATSDTPQIPLVDETPLSQGGHLGGQPPPQHMLWTHTHTHTHTHIHTNTHTRLVFLEHSCLLRGRLSLRKSRWGGGVSKSNIGSFLSFTIKIVLTVAFQEPVTSSSPPILSSPHPTLAWGCGYL